jgi:hypothetical protein
MLHEHARTLRERFDADAYVTAEAQGMLGLALLSAGNDAESLAVFTAVLPVLLEPRSGRALPAETWRLRQILNAYVELLYRLEDSPALRQRGLEARDESFRIAEIARTSMVQNAIAAAAARGALADEHLGELARQEQDLAQQLEAAEAALLAQVELPARLQSAPLVSELRKRIEAGRRAVQHCGRRSSVATPGTRDSPPPEPPPSPPCVK